MNDDSRHPEANSKNRRPRTVAALARDVAREARGAVWHWDQVVTTIVATATGESRFGRHGDAAVELAMQLQQRSERIRRLAVGVVELDVDADARELELMARDVTEMLEAVMQLHTKLADTTTDPSPRRATSNEASSGSWPMF